MPSVSAAIPPLPPPLRSALPAHTRTCAHRDVRQHACFMSACRGAALSRRHRERKKYIARTRVASGTSSSSMSAMVRREAPSTFSLSLSLNAELPRVDGAQRRRGMRRFSRLLRTGRFSRRRLAFFPWNSSLSTPFLLSASPSHPRSLPNPSISSYASSSPCHVERRRPKRIPTCFYAFERASRAASSGGGCSATFPSKTRAKRARRTSAVSFPAGPLNGLHGAIRALFFSV